MEKRIGITVRLLLFIVGYFGNAYFESYTKRKVYFIPGPEFGDLQGHAMITHKALFGLRKFRTNQREAIICALERRYHLFILMPTG